jgi:hypothetical protein
MVVCKILPAHNSFLIRSTNVPHTYLPLTLFDPKYFETTEVDAWKHFDAIRGKFVQESDTSTRNTISAVIGDCVLTYNAVAWEKVLEFTRYREYSQVFLLVPPPFCDLMISKPESANTTWWD